ncbi:MAG TPA: hypothetical protein VMM56_15295, partial [Planctomycetaceae bacterium]|nr:hypothetical protein [Planctomycetaceae bacterium]
PIVLDSGNPSTRRRKPSPAQGTLVSVVVGGLLAGGIYFLLKHTILSDASPPSNPPSVATTSDDRSSNNTSVVKAENSAQENLSVKHSEPLTAASATPRHAASSEARPKPLLDSQELVADADEVKPSEREPDSLPESPESTASVEGEPQPAPVNSVVAANPGADALKKPNERNEEKEREEPKLSKRKWTTLVLLNPNLKGASPIPDDFPIWNFEKGYSFRGSGVDVNQLGDYLVDGEFIIRDGYLRREFGNSALLRLPAAEDFELEGVIQLEGPGGWLMLLGWDLESSSGYVIYNTKLRVSGSTWFVIEIAGGNPVPDSERELVKRDAEGVGALRVLIDKKKVSMQAADEYLFRDEALPNYNPGHVAIGTFSTQYGPQNIGIRSLRMRLR